MGETDYFTVNIAGREIGVSEGRTQYKKIYRLEVDDVNYKIENKRPLEKEYWCIYVKDHPTFRDGLVGKSAWISEEWKWVRDDIKKRIRE